MSSDTVIECMCIFRTSLYSNIVYIVVSNFNALDYFIDRVTCFYRWKMSKHLKTQKSVTKIVTRERIVIDNIWLIFFLFESYTKDFRKILRDYFSIGTKQRYEEFYDLIRVKRRQSTKITIIFIPIFLIMWHFTIDKGYGREYIPRCLKSIIT